MSTDTGRERIDEGRQQRSTVKRLTPAVKPVQSGELPASSGSRESADRSQPSERNKSGGPQENANQRTRNTPLHPVWLHRLGDYGLALLFVAAAVLLRRLLPEVLRPAPFLVFYLAWVGAAAFGGLGPGLLATVLSWLCIDLLYDPTPGLIDFMGLESITRLIIFLAGGLAVSVVGEKMRRTRIHERQQGRVLAAANAALQASEEKYRVVADNTYDWEFWLDPERRFLYISPSCERVTGYSAHEFMNHPGLLMEIIHPEDLPAFLENQRGKPSGRPGDIEFRITTRQGGIRWIHHLCQPIYDRDGRYAGSRGSNRDITERKQAEQDLRESRNRYQALIETTADFIWEMDTSGKYTYCSPQMKALWGYEPQDMIGKTPFDVMPPEDRKQTLARFLSLAQSPQPFAGLEASSYDSQGRLIAVEISGVPFFDADGRWLGYRGISRDVTERKRAEEALQKSEERFAKAFRSSPIAIAVTRLRDGRILDANEAVLKLLHFTRDEVIGHTTRDLDMWVDANDREQFTRMLSTAGSVRDLEFRLRTKEGAIVTIHLSAELLEVSGEPCLLSALVDITERQRAAEALRQEKAFADKLLNAPRDTVFLFEPATGRTIRWNERFAEVSGYNDVEIAALKVPDDFCDEDDLKKARECMAQVLAEGQGVVELSLATKQGRHVPFEYAVTVVETEEGKTLFLSIGRDITERKQAEEALRASQSMLQSVMENIPQAVFWKNRHSTYVGCNRVFAQAAGLNSPEDIVGKTDYDLPWSPEQTASFREYDRRIMESDAPEFHIIERQRETSGKLLWVETNKVPLHDAQGHVIGILGTYEDITERKQAEETLRELNTMLESRVAQRTAQLQQRARQLQKLTLELTEAEERERKRLAEILHDDLQQVLAAAKFQVGLLNSRLRDDAESQELAAHARNLLVDAIAKSRSLSHELSSPALFQSDLGEAFEWLAEQMQKKHGFTVHLEIGERMELASEALRVLLYKAAQEALFNVIKHAGVREATLRLRRQCGRLRLSVADRGRGFDPTAPACTLGFGLLSVRERVELLGGRLKIHSAPGQGSVFLLSVPDVSGQVR